MLEEPQNINDADAESIRALTETYPYFVPARYMQAAQQHKKEPFSQEMMSAMQLFSGNWLLYNEYLQDALGGEEVEFNAPTAPRRTKQAATEQHEVEIEEELVPEAVTEEPATIEEELVEEYSEPVTAKGKEEFTEGFAPEDTGFVRGRKAETLIPAAEEIIEEQPAPVKDRPAPVHAKRVDWDEKNDNLIPPIYTEDYFLHQGMHVSNEIPDELGTPGHRLNMQDGPKSLMVVMSFSEWLMYYKKKKQQEEEEVQDQKDLRTMWQKEKLAAALEEENEEIPENVFEMAVNSITKEENLVSESLAEVLVKQGRYDRAIDMYKKLSLRKPQKKAYFARKIEEILKEK